MWEKVSQALNKMLNEQTSVVAVVAETRRFIQDVEEWRLDTLRFFDIEADEWTAKCFRDLAWVINTCGFELVKDRAYVEYWSGTDPNRGIYFVLAYFANIVLLLSLEHHNSQRDAWKPPTFQKLG